LISEKKILKTFQHLIKQSDADNLIIVGSGDDAAVLDPKGRNIVHSLDISKIDTHFPSNFLPEDIAYRSVAVALSDLAAMGAYPSFITIGLTCDSEDLKWYENFTIGIENSIKDFKVELVGGDVTFGDISVCVNVFGFLFNEPLKRSGAIPGDKIYVTGKLGMGRRGLEDFKKNINSEFSKKFKKPEPQFIKSKNISNLASSCIDISDGLIKDLSSICSMSNVGANINFEDIPILKDIDDLTFGDDFELCFTISEENALCLDKYEYFCIGEIIKGDKISLFKDNNLIELEKDGWDSFK
jgi:thiamine-monophosphate kinase